MSNKNITAHDTISKKDLKKAIDILKKNKVKYQTFYYINRIFPYIHQYNVIDVESYLGWRASSQVDQIIMDVLNTEKYQKQQEVIRNEKTILLNDLIAHFEKNRSYFEGNGINVSYLKSVFRGFKSAVTRGVK